MKANLMPYLIALLSGAIGIFAFSPFDYFPLILLTVSGLLYISRSPVKKRAYLGTLLWGIAYFSIGVNWVHVSMIQFGGVPELVSYLAVLLLGAYLALYPLLFTYLVQRFQVQNPLVLASIWTGTEYLRGVVFTGFPWLQFGYSLIDTPFASIAPLLGVEGLSFFIVAVSGYLVQIFCRKSPLTQAKRFSLSFPYLMLVGLISLGLISRFYQPISIDDSHSTKVSLVQGNIEQRMKWDPAHFNFTVQTYVDLIKPLIGKSDLIILPESAIPAYEQQIAPLLNEIDQAARQQHSELIIGTLHRSQQNQIFNSAVVLGNQETPYQLDTQARYNKHHLVPFGEYVPFGSLLDWLREVFVLPVNLSQGSFIQAPLTAKKQQFNLAICYEIIFGDQVQQNQQAHQADYLLTLSNDAWFGASVGPWQHFQIARMRALELGKPLIRATNTGVTAFVDHHGQVVHQAPQFETTVLTADIQRTTGKTLFAQFGTWLIYGLAGIILLMAAMIKIAYHGLPFSREQK